MKRLKNGVLIVILASSLIVTPVSAEPSVDELRNNTEAVQSQISTLQSELAALFIKIDDLEQNLIQKGEEITKTNEDLEAAEKKEAEHYNRMVLRIRYMYEAGRNTVLHRILSSGSIADILIQAEYVQAIHMYDRKMLEEYVAIKDEIAQLKEILEEEMVELEELQAAYEREKYTLNAALEEQRAELEDFEQQLQAAIQEAERNILSSAGGVNPGSSTPESLGDEISAALGEVGDPAVGLAIAREAHRFLGVPYVWGGTSFNGVDCSGLVMLVHQAVGIQIGRTSAVQGAGGRPVAGRASALPGDVVCYPGHVGIYIGNGQMIHAPTFGQVVRIDPVYGSPWFRRYW